MSVPSLIALCNDYGLSVTHFVNFVEIKTSHEVNYKDVFYYWHFLR